MALSAVCYHFAKNVCINLNRRLRRTTNCLGSPAIWPVIFFPATPQCGAFRCQKCTCELVPYSGNVTPLDQFPYVQHHQFWRRNRRETQMLFRTSNPDPLDPHFASDNPSLSHTFICDCPTSLPVPSHRAMPLGPHIEEEFRFQGGYVFPTVTLAENYACGAPVLL